MQDAWKKLKPKDNYQVYLVSAYNGEDFRTLTRLYQPIIGIDAFAVLTSFLNADEHDISTIKPHSELLNRLDMSLPDFYQARIKLEAVGLLKTFVRTLDNGYHFIYYAEAPIKPEIFLQDDLLSTMLIDKLGKDAFESLFSDYQLMSEELKDYQEITQAFVQVYPDATAKLSTYDDMLISNQHVLTQLPGKQETIKLTTNFDWPFFLSLTESLGLDTQQLQVELKRTIESFHQLYGIDELDMSQFIKSAADYVTNRVDEKRLKQAVYKQYQQNKKQNNFITEHENSRFIPVNVEQLSADEQVVRRYNTLKREGYTDQEISVIKSCDSSPPMLFLKSIKKQRGGYVSTNEQWLIENLKNQSNLPNSVINMLIHYMLVIQNKSSLNQNIANSIANDWAQNKIFSPEAALTKVKQYQKKTAVPNKQGYTKKESKRKETLPDWAKNDNQKEETQISEQEQVAFAEKIKRIQSKKEGES